MASPQSFRTTPGIETTGAFRPGRRGSALSRRWPWIVIAAIVILASVLIVALTDMRPEFDAYGWLVWGRQTLHGHLNLDGAPSWKPLPYLFTLPYALAGSGQMWLWMVTAVAAALGGAVIAGHVAYTLVGPCPERRWAPVGAAAFAALGLLGISTYWHFILISNSDPMIVALCLGAIDCQLSRRYREAFVLLVLGALGRPEVWPFVGLYVLWGWRAVPSLRILFGIGVITVLLLWFGIPALASKSWLSAGNLAEGSVNALHGDKFSGVIGRLIDLYEWPMWLAVVAGVAIAAIRHDRRSLLLVGGALIWVALEVGFALHGWSAVPRYLFEPAAVLIVIGATGIGRLLAVPVNSTGLVRWAGPALAALLLIALVPAARNRARFVHGEISYGRDFARQVDRLGDVVAVHGGGKRFVACGQPVSQLEFQSALAWYVGLNVADVEWRPHYAIRSGRPVVLFQPRKWGWEVSPIHTLGSDRASCAGLRTITAFS